MSTKPSQGISDEKFSPWLRKESWRALKVSLVLLVASTVISAALSKFSDTFAGNWTRFNYRLSDVALEQHPIALARSFAARLGENEYGWGPLFSTTPFNITEAKKKLRAEFPEIASVINGEPQVPRSKALREPNPARYDARIAEFTERYHKIERRRFAKLYDRDDVFTAPNANMQLSIMVTKIFGFIDAFFFTLVSIFSAGFASVLMFTTVLVLSGMALWKSRRPARGWLKFITWPTLASALVWGAILFMAAAAALFSVFTPNTSALALIASLPFLFLLAKLPLHLAETLVAKPAKWDGIERRKPRPPAPESPPPPASPTS
ncbi:hypothetical protein [Oleiharenicola lentus]|uniref:hypothetical protein n=1 Tax=Oleiharenicola lentus TaxID=2508720 RepID=UPI003F66CD06